MYATQHRLMAGLLGLLVCSASTTILAGEPDVIVGQAVPATRETVFGSTGLSFGNYQDATQAATTITVGETTDDLFSVDVTYSLYSDYVFRGINFSEFAGEGREKPNHQLDLSVSLDLGTLLGNGAGTSGTLNFGAWFEWFGAQKKIDPVRGGQNLQEVDYYLSWSYDIAEIATTFTLGYTFYTFPNANAANTSEWWFGLEHNDAWMWKSIWPDNEDGVLNPSFAFYQDVDLGAGNAIWMEIGLSHEFPINDLVTVTPNWLLAIDHGYYHTFAGDRNKNTTRLAYMQWGLDVTYDLGTAWQLPGKLASTSLSGHLYFNDALGNVEDNRIIQDEFFGGFSLGWSF